MTSVKSFSEISYDELMDVNGGALPVIIAKIWLVTKVVAGIAGTTVVVRCTEDVYDEVKGRFISDSR